MKYNIAMVCDYFYPNMGGIETHIVELSLALIERGHKVIGITHKYAQCRPIEHVGKFKIYYLNIPTFHRNTVFPGFFANFFQIANVLHSEKIDIVHGHQSMSSLCYEALLNAQTHNLRCVFTDHSMFETGAVENIIVNHISRFVLRCVDKAICVSYALKENLIDRTGMGSGHIHVIPNAVSRVFRASTRTRSDTVRVISSCRFVYRKGVDLLIRAIPRVCSLDSRIEFVVIGDGPKRDGLEQMIDDHNLADRVSLLGLIDHKRINNILRTGDVFLNTSLTESFCMAIVEAAACGLQIVSTNVGAISEVLPPSMITLVGLDEDEIAAGVARAIERLHTSNKKLVSKETKRIYSWKRVAAETEAVYADIGCKEPRSLRLRLRDRLLIERGVLALCFRIIIVANYVLLALYTYFKQPKLCL